MGGIAPIEKHQSKIDPMIFKRGEMLRTVPEAEKVDALMEEIDKWEKEEGEKGSPKLQGKETPRKSLPLVKA